MARLTFEEVIRRSKELYGEKYTFEHSIYTGLKNEMIITCDKHGDFLKKPIYFLDKIKKSGCPICCSGKLTNEEFIEKAYRIHEEEYYDYIEDYYNSKTKIIILCKVCGNFFTQKPNSHFNGDGCPFCGGTRKLTKEEFIRKANIHHKGKYTYEKLDLENNNTKSNLIITCPEHGDFLQRGDEHLIECGCPKCADNTPKSLREKEIFKILVEKGYVFEKDFFKEQKFDDLRSGKSKRKGIKQDDRLKFDFYIPSKNILIEHQGSQHYEPKSFGIKDEKLVLQRFEEQQLYDNMKREYCKLKNINLLEIKYTDDIEKLLTENNV